MALPDKFQSSPQRASFNNILSGIVSSTNGIFLYSIYGFNPTAVQLYFQAFNLVAVPANGATTMILDILCPANSEFSYSPSKELSGISFNVGMVFCMSTTPFVKTIVLAGSEFRTDVEYGLQ